MAKIATRIFGFLIATATVRYKLVRSLIISTEALFVFITIASLLFYTKWLIARYRPTIQGQKLQHKALKNRFKFKAPKFIDLGFSDIPIFPEGTWSWKHQNFSFFANRGQRPYMEDRMHYMNDPHHNLCIFSIFDGHGGPFVSQYLEEHFSTAIRNRLLRFGQNPGHRLSLTGQNEDTVVQAIVTEVHNIDDAISRLHPSLTSLTGSTLISVILEKNRFLTVINVGDSRAVACDSFGSAIALSADHKPSDVTVLCYGILCLKRIDRKNDKFSREKMENKANERRRIESAGGFIEFKGVERVQGILSVTRAFGDTDLKRLCVLTAHPDIVRVDLRQITLRFILVASDGFWDVLSNQKAINLAKKFLAKEPQAHWHKITEYLTKTALSLGTEDNVSVLFLRL